MTFNSTSSISKSHFNLNKEGKLNFLWLELTEKCNLFCIHCYNESSPRKSLRGNVNTETWKRVLREGYELGCKSVQFIGGEVTMHPELKLLIEYADDIGYEFIELFSNLTIVDEYLISTLKKHKVQVAGSFYSSCPEIHNKITQRVGSYRKTVNGIQKIIENNLPLRIGIINMEENKDEFDNTISFLKKLGVRQENIGSDRIREYGRGGCNSKLKQDPYGELCGQCGNGKLCVTSSGNVHPCIMSRMLNAGNVNQDSLKSVLSSDQLIAFKEIMSERNENLESDKTESLEASSKCNPEKCNPQRHCYPDNTPCSPQDCYPIK